MFNFGIIQKLILTLWIIGSPILAFIWQYQKEPFFDIVDYFFYTIMTYAILAIPAFILFVLWWGKE